jgi:YD repeat-containing protein
MVATIPVPRVRRWHDPSAPRFDPRGLRSRRPCRPEWLTSYRADGSRSALEVRENGSASPADALTFEDDPLGRPYLVKRGTTTLTDYTWSPDGTLAARADAGVGTTAYGYDWAGRLTSITPPAAIAPTPVNQTWRPDGLLATRSWPGGETMTAGYDAAKRPVSLAFAGAGSLTQAYDRDGNVVSEGRSLTGIAGEAGSGVQNFSYDPLNRLTGSTGLPSGARSYAYDRNGNRTAKTEGGLTFTATYDRTDALVSVGIGVPVGAVLDALRQPARQPRDRHRSRGHEP